MTEEEQAVIDAAGGWEELALAVRKLRLACEHAELQDQQDEDARNMQAAQERAERDDQRDARRMPL